MKGTLLALVFFLVGLPMISLAQWLFAHNAVFTVVTGNVTVMDEKGLFRAAETEAEVFPGETIRVGQDSRATLRLFDGSIVELRAETEFLISSLKHPTDKEKQIRFALKFGWITAKVQKLLTSSSLFEVEAGGVVCGVRGTKFTVGYSPAEEKVDLKVAEGTVYAKTGGVTRFIKAGESIEFIKGRPVSGPVQGLQPNTGADQATEAAMDTVGGLSLSLSDLNSQFTQNLSINGISLTASPVLGSSIQSNLHLATVNPIFSSNPLLNLQLPKIP